jgi:hypothetical protein
MPDDIAPGIISPHSKSGMQEQRNKIEGILIAAMPTANSAHPKLSRKKLDRSIAGLLIEIQSRMLTGSKGETAPEESDDEEAGASKTLTAAHDSSNEPEKNPVPPLRGSIVSYPYPPFRLRMRSAPEVG